jgi:F-type H+-transporting ATPase subunit delta
LIAGSLAKRYAKALVEVAAAARELDPVARELGEFAALLRGQRQLRQFFANPSIQRRDKVGAYEQIAARLAVRPLTRTFLRVLLEAGRLGELENVLRAYEGLVDERLGRVKAVVTSAVPLPAETQERLRQRLQAELGKQVYLEARQDPGLLGGVVTRIGSVVYDGSLKMQLRRLREELVRG